MFTNTLLLLTALAKILAVASILQLPLDNAQKFIRSSEPVLILVIFCFVAGETRSIVPAVIATALYIYTEIVPRKLTMKDEYFKNSQKA